MARARGGVLERPAGRLQGPRRAHAQGTAAPVSAADAVTVAVDVEVAPDVAFDVFTRELDAWWGHGPRFRFLAPHGGRLTLEPGVGGRLLHVQDERVFVDGARVSVTHSGWDGIPPTHPAR